ncbi:unnamed protein product [Ranitomeya imitator]|uniref:Uncharacterized protein n=1 Tax=Ranitomeya imitator TaxID=111125 RepID=A0ABN9MML1_9NEOB|nr:unnamed protein product [Ranitomeya imitator]
MTDTPSSPGPKASSRGADVDVALKCLSVLRTSPTTRTGLMQKYESGCRWLSVPAEDQQKMTKLDGQVWISLYNLLAEAGVPAEVPHRQLHPGTAAEAPLSSHRGPHRSAAEPVKLQRFLSHLSVSDAAPPKKELILEQVPEVYDSIIREDSGKWKAIAKHQIKHNFSPSDSELRQQAQRWAQTYNMDVMEALVPRETQVWDPVEPRLRNAAPAARVSATAPGESGAVCPHCQRSTPTTTAE